MKKLIGFSVLVLLMGWGGGVSAQEVHQELQETVRAQVIEILSERTEDIIGTDTESTVQEIRVRILGGMRTGDVATFEQDLMRVAPGDTIYVNRLMSIDGTEYYTFKDADRIRTLVVLGVLFALVLLAFSGFHGVRAILSLLLSIGLIALVLVPLLLAGYSPVLTSIAVAVPILAAALFITHGVHARSVIALMGTLGAVVVTGTVAYVFVTLAHLTGLSSDEAIYLNFSTKGTLDFGGLLLGSIIIGILGILDDVSITQAAVVSELRRANRSLSVRELYVRALRVGRDHISSLVNTLSLAYIGAALPLVLLLTAAHSSIVLSLNQELVAVELIRILVGSIGLILAVPLTTGIAAVWYGRYASREALIRDDAAHHHH